MTDEVFQPVTFASAITYAFHAPVFRMQTVNNRVVKIGTVSHVWRREFHQLFEKSIYIILGTSELKFKFRKYARTICLNNVLKLRNDSVI